YGLTFRADHPWNVPSPGTVMLLRNEWLVWMKASGLHRVVCFLPVAWVVLSLAVTELKRPAFYLLYPCAILNLAPSWLVEPRYCLPFLVLFLLLRERRSPAVETANLVWSILVAGVLVAGTARGWFFL
ncbi:hypothetical protein QWT45_29825, partial [Escherichia coli]|uniref:hypothetical protein n=1 Tax=Escherichia coli TaxID=562 RepID=UPI002A81B4C2